jgi:hypothetical protein
MARGGEYAVRPSAPLPPHLKRRSIVYTVVNPGWSEVVECLNHLVADLRSLESWPRIDIDACLLLYDVFQCLDLSPRSIHAIMGDDAMVYIREHVTTAYDLTGRAHHAGS